VKGEILKVTKEGKQAEGLIISKVFNWGPVLSCFIRRNSSLRKAFHRQQNQYIPSKVFFIDFGPL